MALKKEVETKGNVKTLWERRVESVPMVKYVEDTADTEKLLLFSETGAGKTTFYLNILRYLRKKGVKKEDLFMCIVTPDRPTGVAKLFNLIPKEYIGCVEVFAINDYEESVIATATAEEKLEAHFKKTGKFGWLVFELMENYWTFAQDYYCRRAYGKTMGEYFAQMQTIMSKDKAEKKTAYEAFAGPFGGPWPIIKFFHNFNWIDKIKRFPYNVIFTSEIKEETNKDSIFHTLGYRPAGEKHNQHRMDTILYLSHKGNNFFMKPFKLTGYRRLYGELNITEKNGYEVYKDALKRLEELGHCVSKMDDIEAAAGITPPKKKAAQKLEPKPKLESKTEPIDTKPKIVKEKGEKEGMWEL